MLFLLYFTPPFSILSYFASLLLRAIRAPTVSSSNPINSIRHPTDTYIASSHMIASASISSELPRLSSDFSSGFASESLFTHGGNATRLLCAICIIRLNDNDRRAAACKTLSLSFPFSFILYR